MEKYSFEFKKQVIQDYINGKGGVEYLAKKYSRTLKKTKSFKACPEREIVMIIP